MSAQTTHIRLAGAAFIFIGFAVVTLGCGDVFNGSPVTVSRGTGPVEVFAVKYRISEDLRRTANGNLQDCPVISGASDQTGNSVLAAFSNQSGSSRQYVAPLIDWLKKPNFDQIDLVSANDKTARLTVKGEGRITLRGVILEHQPINVTYFLAEDRGSWHCMHVHASFDPKSLKLNRVGGW